MWAKVYEIISFILGGVYLLSALSFSIYTFIQGKDIQRDLIALYTLLGLSFITEILMLGSELG